MAPPPRSSTDGGGRTGDRGGDAPAPTRSDRRAPARPLSAALALAFVLALGGVAAPRPALAAAPAIGWSAIARKVVPAVVNISVLTIDTGAKHAGIGEREEEVGSGFIVDPSGVIVTNKHVIAGAFRITVRLNDGTELPAKVIAAASMVDLAVLKVDAGHPLPVLKLAPAGAVQPGDPVLAIGNPLGVGTSLSAGIVSGLNRNLMKTPFDDYVQTDAAINHGNSGGPLIDTAGQVVGVDTILLTNLPNEGSNGLGFAISSTVVGYVVHHLIDPRAAPLGWIGTQLQDLTPDLAQAFGMAGQRGILVTGIDADSPAARAGLHAGDVILSYWAQAMDQPPDARAMMRDVATIPIGRKLVLEIRRAGKTMAVPVTVRAWPNMMEPRGSMVAAQGAALPLPSPDLGLLLARITPVARQQYKLGAAKGVLVVAVDKQSEAYLRGLNPGDLIERVQDQAVTDPAEVYRLARAAAARGRFVALLVRRKNGTSWIALHADGGGEADGTMAQGSDRSAPAEANGAARAGRAGTRP